MKVWSSIVTVCLSNLFTFHRNGVNNVLRWQIMFSVAMSSFLEIFIENLTSFLVPEVKILSYHYFPSLKNYYGIQYFYISQMTFYFLIPKLLSLQISCVLYDLLNWMLIQILLELLFPFGLFRYLFLS